MRRALIRLLNEFREEPVQLDLNEVPLQSVTLDAPQDELPGDGREEAARLRALEMSELLATVEEEEREAEDVDAQAERRGGGVDSGPRLPDAGFAGAPQRSEAR